MTGDLAHKNAPEPIFALTSANWVAVFVALAMCASLLPFLGGFFLGLSVASDVIFGIYALIGGLAADFILRAKFGKALVVWQKPTIPFIVLWVLLCLYVIVFQPLD